jgi:hypothetical protein
MTSAVFFLLIGAQFMATSAASLYLLHHAPKCFNTRVAAYAPLVICVLEVFAIFGRHK